MDNRKESADMLEHARQINEDADLIGEQIVLTKKQQFCIAKHLQGFRLLENGDKNIVSVCCLCKYVPSCVERPIICRIEIMELFQRLTGVDLTSWRQRTIEELPDYLLDYAPSDQDDGDKMALEQHVTQLEKEMADLKRQLGERSIRNIDTVVITCRDMSIDDFNSIFFKIRQSFGDISKRESNDLICK